MRPREKSEQAAAVLLGQAIRAARYRSGLSQARLGEAAWLHQTTISRLESASLRGMRFATLLRVLAALGTTSMSIDVERHTWFADLLRYEHEGHDRAGAWE